MGGFDPALRAQRGRIGGLTTQVRHPHAVRRAQQAFSDKFLREVDPDGLLPEDERQRQADLALRAHMSRLAYKSAVARARRKLAKLESALEAKEARLTEYDS